MKSMNTRTLTIAGTTALVLASGAALAGAVAPPSWQGNPIERAIAENFKEVLIFGVGGAVAIIWIFLATIHSASKTKQREQTRREIAAYVAEGTMKPEDAERLLKATPRNDEDDED
jgi:hypothetical protein